MAQYNITLKYGDLVSMPCKKENAVETEVSFTNLCTGTESAPHPPSPRKQPYVCEKCGPITSDQTIVKGLKQGAAYVIFTQDEVAEAKEFVSEHLAVISLVAHPASEFLAGTAPGKSINFITPATEAVAGQYRTIMEFIGSHPELAFVGLHTPKSATGLFQVSVRDGVLVMQERVRSQSLKATPVVGGEPMTKLQMFLEMTLEDSLTEYSPDAYEDKYKTAIETLAADTKRLVAGTEGALTATVVGSSDVDLLAKLAALSTEVKPKKKAAKKAVPSKKKVAA